MWMLILAQLPAAEIDYNRDIRPIFADKCYPCHGPDANARQAELRLDIEDGVFRAGEGVIVRGKSSESELVRRISASDDNYRMPPVDSNRSLSVEEVRLVTRWIDDGAQWGEHWAFRAPRRSDLPPVVNTEWVRSEIDRFVLARLEQEGLEPTPTAQRETLIRRATLDLTGLPPSLEEIDRFLEDRSPDAYEKLVDRLLHSPAYGERMVWDWLDAARYADTNGYQGDSERTMWPWRDWALEAMNGNVPFDQFTVEQLAGDLVPDATLQQRIATGFNRNHMINGEGGRISEENRVEYVFDQLETTATVWLGLTVGCARCHDHKFDPVTQREYYRLYAFFNNTTVEGSGGSGQMSPVVVISTPAELERLKQLDEDARRFEHEIDTIERRLFPREESRPPAESGKAADLPAEVRDALAKSPIARGAKGNAAVAEHFKQSNPEYTEKLIGLKGFLEARDSLDKARPRVMVMQERKEPRSSYMLTRGVYNQRGEEVKAGLPAMLPRLPADAPANRLGLARWLTSSDHPLTARVIVNRHWQLFFGNGLVETVEDFGAQGNKPSHPGLLDWLAIEFVRTGWDVKRLHRLIVTSATYQQASKANPEVLERDPLNRLLTRGPRYRLPSFMIRDQALAVSGLLVRTVGGPPVNPYQPSGIWEEATFGKKKYSQDHGERLYRRSLYTFWRRIVGPTIFFDSSARQTCTVRSHRTNTPLHALITLNDVTYVEAARALAQRVLQDAADDESRVRLLFRLATARLPSENEQQILADRRRMLEAVYSESPQEASKLLSVGESPRDESIDPIQHAVYTALSTLVLNLDEVLNKE